MSGASLPLPPAALASSSSTLLLAQGSSLHVYAASTGQTSHATPPNSLGVHGLVRHVAISPDSAYAATIGDDKALRVYAISSGAPELLSTRTVLKRCAHLTFTPLNELILSDKVGDTYLYPLEPNKVEGERPAMFALASDPSLNPDAKLLLGHTSIITQHVLAPGGKRLITADRDEHIRLSRYPATHIIDNYLFGSQGFVSAVHIPETRPDLLVSAGGGRFLRLWDWSTGKQVGELDIFEAVLPARTARCNARKMKNHRKRARQEDDDQDPFYTPPEGYILPEGQGVCVKKIDSVAVAEATIVYFFSEGCSAVHAFALAPGTSSTPSSIQTCTLPHPVLDCTPLPGSPDHLLVSLDSSWGVLRQNAVDGPQAEGKIAKKEFSEDELQQMKQTLAVVRVGADAELSLVPQHPVLSALYASLNNAELSVPPEAITSLQLYPLLSLLPRWLGMEEDDDLAGPAPGTAEGEIAGAAQASASSANVFGAAKKAAKKAARQQQQQQQKQADPHKEHRNKVFKSEMGKPARTYTREELEQMNVKTLGRLRSQGVDVGNLIYEKKQALRNATKPREPKSGAAAAESEQTGQAEQRDAAPEAAAEA